VWDSRLHRYRQSCRPVLDQITGATRAGHLRAVFASEGVRLDSAPRCSYEWPMSSRLRKPSNANRATTSRSWRASLIRRKGQVLGDVEAPSREAAEAEAVRTFNLSPEQRSRLVVQERG